MAEDQTAQEEHQDSEEQEAEGQAQEGQGQDESQKQDEETQASAEDSGSGDSGEEDEEVEDERGESEGKIGDVEIDEVDPNEPTQDDDVAAAQMRKLEKEGPPENLGDWPTGKAMYLTFGGSEGGEGYEEGSPSQMGPSSLRHYPDGSVEVKGEMVDNPEDYKAEETVFEEHEKIGMDKGAKTDDGGDDSGDDSADDSAEGEDSTSSEGEDSASSEGDGSQPEGASEESEKAEAS